MRTHFYFCMSMLEDEEAQRNAITGILYNIDQPVLDQKTLRTLTQLRKVLPIRVVGQHVCYNDPSTRAIISFVLKVVGSFGRVRYKGHYGTPTECLYSLMTYDFPTDCVPKEISRLDNFRVWLHYKLDLVLVPVVLTYY
jgi:hypothetical protein